MLAADVWPALVAAVVSIVDVPPTTAQVGTFAGMPAVGLKGLAEGEQLSVPESPYAWLMNSRGTIGPFGSDKVKTDWTFVLRLMYEWENDSTLAERALQPIIEQVRMLFQQHLKLGTGTIVDSRISDIDWGYTPVNAIWYRSCDMTISISEKEIRNTQA
jgi:hypothetical protein